jgi:hypothetical protein
MSEKLTKLNYVLWHAQVMTTFAASVEKSPAKTITSKDDKGTPNGLLGTKQSWAIFYHYLLERLWSQL